MFLMIFTSIRNPETWLASSNHESLSTANMYSTQLTIINHYEHVYNYIYIYFYHCFNLTTRNNHWHHAVATAAVYVRVAIDVHRSFWTITQLTFMLLLGKDSNDRSSLEDDVWLNQGWFQGGCSDWLTSCLTVDSAGDIHQLNRGYTNSPGLEKVEVSNCRQLLRGTGVLRGAVDIQQKRVRRESVSIVCCTKWTQLYAKPSFHYMVIQHRYI